MSMKTISQKIQGDACKYTVKQDFSHPVIHLDSYTVCQYHAYLHN